MFQLTTAEKGGAKRVETFATMAELRFHAVNVEGVPMERFTNRVAGRAHTSYTFQGWTWTWSEVAEVAPVKTTERGAAMLRQFADPYYARQAEMNGGTLIFGGRMEAPVARKLVRDGLLARVGDSRVTYRLTEAGQAWLATTLEEEL